MNLSKINPYIRVAMRGALKAHSKIKRRVIYDYELIYIYGGTMIFEYDEKSYRCKQGDILLICPGVPHSFTMFDEPLVQPHIHFDITARSNGAQIPVSYKDLHEMTSEEKSQIHEDYFPNRKSPFVTVADREKFLSLFNPITTHSVDPITQKAYLIQILSLIINDNFPNFFEPEDDFSIVQQVRDFIDSGQAFKMSLDDFKQQFFYSKFYLDKKFAEVFGESIIAYRNKKRMEKAQAMLKNNSVTFVAEYLGYGSIFAFSRAYKLHFGHSPKSR